MILLTIGLGLILMHLIFRLIIFYFKKEEIKRIENINRAMRNQQLNNEIFRGVK